MFLMFTDYATKDLYRSLVGLPQIYRETKYQHEKIRATILGYFIESSTCSKDKQENNANKTC